MPMSRQPTASFAERRTASSMSPSTSRPATFRPHSTASFPSPTTGAYWWNALNRPLSLPRHSSTCSKCSNSSRLGSLAQSSHLMVSDDEFQFSVESLVNIQQYEMNSVEMQPRCSSFSARRTTQHLPFAPDLAPDACWRFEYQGPNCRAATQPSAKRKTSSSARQIPEQDLLEEQP